jgi:hypothetical protein
MLDLPPADVLEVLRISTESNEQEVAGPWRFGFPVTISGNLRCVVVLRTLWSVWPDTAAGDEEQLGANTIFSQRLQSRSSTRNLYSNLPYESMFSPMGDAIAFFERNASKTLSPQILEIWSRIDSQSRHAKPEHKFRGRQLIGSIEFERVDSKSFLFHPSRPCLAFAEWGRASIWCYNEADSECNAPSEGVGGRAEALQI